MENTHAEETRPTRDESGSSTRSPPPVKRSRPRSAWRRMGRLRQSLGQGQPPSVGRQPLPRHQLPVEAAGQQRHLSDRIFVSGRFFRRELGHVAVQMLRLSLWNVPICARLSMLQIDSIPLVWACPRTYSPTLCRTV